MKILAVIPARSGSKGIRNKNIVKLQGKPLMQYAITTALQTTGISKVIVSTDSEEFAEVAREGGADVPFLRPAALASDEIRLLPVLAHALSFFDDRGERYDAVLNVQATAPLTSVATLQAMIEKMEQTGCEAVATVSEVRHEHPYLVLSLAGDQADTIEPFLTLPPGVRRYPRQARPRLHVYTGAAFLRRRHLIELADDLTNALGARPRGVVVDSVESINIDDAADLGLADYYLSRKPAEL